MRHYSHGGSTLLGVSTLMFGTFAHASPLRYEIVAATGRQAPGTPAGTTFSMLGYP